MKSLLLVAVFLVSGQAAVLPGVIGTWKHVSTAPLPVTADKPLWDELGLRESEQGTYSNQSAEVGVEAWRLTDSTAALGAFDYLRPADSRLAPKFEPLTSLAVLLPDGALIAQGNYLLRFKGGVPEVDAVANMLRSMPRYETAPLPQFVSHLPPKEVPNTEHYVGGPVALRKFFPGMEPSQAAFHLGAEAVVAEYKPGLSLALFSYPTPYIARDRAAAFEKVPGAVVKRSGPLVAVVLHPSDANAAESLLAKVRYQATVTTGEKPPSKKDNPGNLLLNVLLLIGILAGFCIASGLVFAMIRIAFRRTGPSGEGEEILTLHLE